MSQRTYSMAYDDDFVDLTDDMADLPDMMMGKGAKVSRTMSVQVPK